MILGIVLDLDDTLYPEREYVRSGFAEIDRRLCGRGDCRPGEFERTSWALFEEGCRGRIIDESLALLGIAATQGLVDDLVAAYRAHEPCIHLFADADRFLSRVAGRARLGLLTDGFGSSQRRKVAALGLESRVPAIVYSDDLGRAHWKPDPLPFRTMEVTLGMQASELVYVGDNPAKDFVGARACGWRTVRVRRPGTLHFDVNPGPGCEPEAEVPSLDMLPGDLSRFLAG